VSYRRDQSATTVTCRRCFRIFRPNGPWFLFPVTFLPLASLCPRRPGLNRRPSLRSARAREDASIKADAAADPPRPGPAPRGAGATTSRASIRGSAATYGPGSAGRDHTRRGSVRHALVADPCRPVRGRDVIRELGR